MDASILLKIKQCFSSIPEKDNRAATGPREFVINLIFGFMRDTEKRSIAGLRRQIIGQTGKSIARSTFWNRLSTKRLRHLLTSVVMKLIKRIGTFCLAPKRWLDVLGVKAVYLLDSSSSTLPSGAKNEFPAPRNNVAPAAVKWHLCMDLFTGVMKWFEITAATSHDRKSFPPLDLLKGALIIMDLGYWDYDLLSEIGKAGYFLSRIKANATIEVLKVIQGFPVREFKGKLLFDCRLPKKKSRIVEVLGALGPWGNAVLEARVIGFWNPIEHCYHWYVTNLKVPAQLIYPLYRLRWQIELIFKASKNSLRLDDIPSANKNIIQNLVLLALVATLLTFPLMKVVSFKLENEQQTATSFQRSAMIFLHIVGEFQDYIMKKGRRYLENLIRKITLLSKELYDPNYKKRETSLQRVLRMAENC